MAGALTSNMTELLKETFKTPFLNMVREDLTMLKFFSQTSQSGGTDVEWKVQYGSNDSVGPYNETETFGQAGHQSYNQAKTPFRLNHVLIQVSGLAEASTRGQGAFYEALAQETKFGLINLKDELNQQLMLRTGRRTSSSGALGLDSLGYLVDNGTIDGTSTTYAGISRTASYWEPYILDNGGTARSLTLELMQAVAMEMRKPERKANIDTIMASDVQFYQYGNLLADQRRWTNTMTLDGGFTALPFEGRKIISIPGLPAGDIYFLEKGQFNYVVLLDFQTEEKNVNSDAHMWHVKTYSQLVLKAPAKQARITDLFTS